jgi:hypothetical protein
VSTTNDRAAQNGYQAQIANIDITRLTRAERAVLLAECKALEGRLLAGLLADSDRETTNDASVGGDRLLTVDQTSAMLAVPRPWLYRRAKRLGLAVKLGDGTLRFSFRACQKLIEGGLSTSRGARSRPADSV